MEKIKIIAARPGEQPEITEIENTLEAKQKFVGGLIELCELEDGVNLICNEEFRILGLPDNREVPYWGMIGGPFFICGNDPDDDSKFGSIPDDTAKKYMKLLKLPDEEPKIKVIAARPGEQPEIVEISRNLKAMQGFVGGYIEAHNFHDDPRVWLVCDEEGKLKGYPPNRAVPDYGMISGPFFICGINPRNSAEFGSIPANAVEKYMKILRLPDERKIPKSGAKP